MLNDASGKMILLACSPKDHKKHEKKKKLVINVFYEKTIMGNESMI